MGTAREIAAALSGHGIRRLADGSFLVPCPVSNHGKGRGDQHPSLQIKDGRKQVLLHCYAGCDRRTIADELRRRRLLDPSSPITGAAPAAAAMNRASIYRDHPKRQIPAWLWSLRQPIAATPAERYLRHARAFEGLLPATLGFLPARRSMPCCLIAACGIPDEIEPGLLGVPADIEAVHLTYLQDDGSGKADIEQPKQMRGSMRRNPIVLAPINDLLGLAITEGIEDALAAHQATGLGAWAAGSASLLPGLADVVPGYVETVTLFAHNDKAGRDNARKLGQALCARGVDVRIEGISDESRRS